MEKSTLPVLAVGIGLLLASSGCSKAAASHGDPETSQPNRREIDERNSRPFPKLRLAVLPLRFSTPTIMS